MAFTYLIITEQAGQRLTTNLSAEAPIYCFASSGNNIFAGTGDYYGTSVTGGVFLSTDNGNSWTAVSNGLPSPIGVYSLAIKGDTIFAGTGGDGVFLSDNNGTSWTWVSNGLPINYVQWLYATTGRSSPCRHRSPPGCSSSCSGRALQPSLPASPPPRSRLSRSASATAPSKCPPT